MRVGLGIDVHPFSTGRRLVLCGVEIPHERGLSGHSDGDVAIHALMDALLGAAGLEDIGTLFPNTSEWQDASSLDLLAIVGKLIAASGYRLVNADMVFLLEEPRIAPWRSKMREILEKALLGRGEGIAVLAIVLLEEV
jgi:2-C-methyl-D-erythritol 2,4-cyclodiphosphate synthase